MPCRTASFRLACFAVFLLICFLTFAFTKTVSASSSSVVWAQEASSAPPPSQQVSDKPEQEPAVPMTESQKAEVRGDICMARKQYVEAVLQYEEALKLDKMRAPLMNKIGIAYHQQMQFDRARKYYQRALKTNKGYAEVRNNLGALYYDMRKYRQSVNEFRKAIALQPELA